MPPFPAALGVEVWYDKQLHCWLLKSVSRKALTSTAELVLAYRFDPISEIILAEHVVFVDKSVL
jgi:hypothetical protein